MSALAPLDTPASAAQTRERAFASQGLFALDPNAAKVNASHLKSISHAVVAAGMLGMSCTELGQRAHGVAPSILGVVTLLFIVDHLDAARRIRDGSMFLPAAWPRRLAAFVVPMLYTASFGAPSHYLAAPTWAFYAMGGVARGIGGSRVDAASVFATFACGLGLHVATATVTPASLATAVAVCTLACFTHVLGERMVLHAIDVEERLAIVDALSSSAQEEAQRSAVAMSLHDGLSGLVFGLRTKLEGDPPVEQLRDEVAQLSQRARELLAPLSTHPALEPALRDLARVYGVPVAIVHLELESVRPLEASDLAFSALELTANTLRHAKPSRVEVEVRASPERLVRVTGFGAAPSVTDGVGRGSRHLELRARSWGGTSTRAVEGSAVVSLIRWPAQARRAGPHWLSLAIPLAASLLGALVWLGDAPPLSYAFVAMGIVLSASMVGLGAQSLRASATRITLTTNLRESRLHAFATDGGQRFEEAILELGSASAAAEVSRLRAALSKFSEVLQDVLRRLEDAGRRTSA